MKFCKALNGSLTVFAQFFLPLIHSQKTVMLLTQDKLVFIHLFVKSCQKTWYAVIYDICCSCMYLNLTCIKFGKSRFVLLSSVSYAAN